MSGTTSTFGYQASTVRTFTATTGGTYQITAIGAAGQGSTYATGGMGADLVADFTLAAGEQLTIVVGGYASANTSTGVGGGGGGGGTFVIETNTGTAAAHTLLLVAGGGGGSGYAPLGYMGSITPANGGNAVYSSTIGTARGGSGQGGPAGVSAHDYTGGGGGGYAGGAGGSYSISSQRGYAGGAGTEQAGSNPGRASNYSGGAGTSQTGGHAGFGGFGGGGGGGLFGGGGGGGGYGGGNGGAASQNSNVDYVSSGGAGGGSFNGGTLVSAALSSTSGNGSVTIEALAPLCFLRGTNILTPTGQMLVEDLRIGDPVVTRFGGIRPVKWVGRQTHAGETVRKDFGKVPVCIHAGAISKGVPARDLYISPGHSMLVDGNLLIGSLMVNGVTVTQHWSPPVIDYYHIELDTHDCVIAEGAWSETYADAQVSRERFHNAAEFHALYPDDGPAPDEFQLCAPRPEVGSMLERALRGLVARCAERIKPGPLRGSVDLIDGAWRVMGWAHDLDHPAMPVLLDVEIGGEVMGQVLACDERADLKRAGYGRGRCAFSFTSPRRLTPALLATLRVRRAADGEELSIHPSCSAAVGPVTAVTASPGLRLVA